MSTCYKFFPTDPFVLCFLILFISGYGGFIVKGLNISTEVVSGNSSLRTDSVQLHHQGLEESYNVSLKPIKINFRRRKCKYEHFTANVSTCLNTSNEVINVGFRKSNNFEKDFGQINNFMTNMGLKTPDKHNKRREMDIDEYLKGTLNSSKIFQTLLSATTNLTSYGKKIVKREEKILLETPEVQKLFDDISLNSEDLRPKTRDSDSSDDTPNYFLTVTIPSLIGIVIVVVLVCFLTCLCRTCCAPLKVKQKPSPDEDDNDSDVDYDDIYEKRGLARRTTDIPTKRISVARDRAKSMVRESECSVDGPQRRSRRVTGDSVDSERRDTKYPKREKIKSDSSSSGNEDEEERSESKNAAR